LKLPDALLFDVNLHLEHSGHKLDITGSGPEYTVRFPSVFSLLHYAITFWPLRKHLPEGAVIQLKYRFWSYRYRANRTSKFSI
jgi:hypothetical protein